MLAKNFQLFAIYVPGFGFNEALVVERLDEANLFIYSCKFSLNVMLIGEKRN